MGSRHNRRRTRSRPRNRMKSRVSTFSTTYEDLSFYSAPSWPLVQTQQPAFDSSYYAPVDLTSRLYARTLPSLHQQTAIDLSHHSEDGGADAHCIRFFGGDEHDETSLCAPMLQVVLDLFGGQIDYEDP